MKKEDLIRKISSRKFQALIVAILLPLLALLKVDEPTKGHLIAMITAGIACVGYMFAEATVDAAREKAPQYIEVITDSPIEETLENHGGGVLSKPKEGGE